jgi:glycosyltransferase involved in cell wall biosynthesis
VSSSQAGRRVGIVIPAFDAERFLGETLASVRAQTHTDWRCVVVDDGSSDSTHAVAAEAASGDPRIEVVAQGNAGPVVARNHGFALIEADVDFVTFMDADDVWRPGALATLLEGAGACPGAIGAHGLAEFIDESGQPYLPGVFASMGRNRLGCRGGRPRPWPVDRPTTFENVVVQSVLFPPGLILARASAYRRIGGWDERFRYAEDWEILIRLLRLGDLAFVDEVLLGYRRHGGNHGTDPRCAPACAAARREAYFSPRNSPQQRATVRDAWRAAQILDAKERWSTGFEALRSRDLRMGAHVLSRLPLVAGRYLLGRPARSPRLRERS